MAAPRIQIPRSTLVAFLALICLSAAAQPEPGPRITPERVIAVSGAPDEPPPVVYAAPDAPLLVIFDGALRKDAAVPVQGAEVRLHPFIPNALVITLSKSLAGQSSVPVLVPMAEGAIPLTLNLSRAQRDATVRIVHRAVSGPPAASQDELNELVAFVLGMALDTGNCPKADSTDVPRWVPQASDRLHGVTACGGGALAYIGASPQIGCQPASARLTRGTETAGVLLVRQAFERHGDIFWLVVARTPGGDGRGFKLDLLAEGGAPCTTYTVDLKP